MGGFFILRENARAEDKATISQMNDAARNMGYGKPAILRQSGFKFFVFPKIGGDGQPAIRRYPNGDFAFVCGTLIYRGRVGEEAVDLLYQELREPRFLPDICYGHFALVINRNGNVSVVGDKFGGYQIYCDMFRNFISSSLLLIAAAMPTVSLSIQGIYEYVFNGIVSGNETLLREILRLPIGAIIKLGADVWHIDSMRLAVPEEFDAHSNDEQLERVQHFFDGYFADIASVFSDNVSCALSGGYDSRLLLALLRRHSIRPRLYVYGQNSDPDVQLAMQICAGEGLPLDVIDKGTDLGPLDRFEEVVDQNYWSNDGYVWAGLFDNGAETMERRRRVASGALGLNGGGGEILRNFFYLIDGEYSVRQLLWCFYSRFDPIVCTDVFLPEYYYRQLEEKISELMGDTSAIPRPAVSWLYHRFRCRSWDGKVNTDNNRYGYATLPFQENVLTEIACRIPTARRNHGIFEALLINRIDKRLARYPSTYGHSFASGPSLNRKVKDYMSMLRPTSLRRLSFRLQHRLGISDVGTFPERAFLQTILGGKVEFVNQFFRLERMRDQSQINRVLSLEYLVRRLGAKLDIAVD